MSKRKRSIVFVVCFLSCLILWIYHDSGESRSDEVKYQNWVRNGGARSRLKMWEIRLPAPLAGILQGTGLTQKYEKNAEVQEEALFRSGYLVRVSIAVANESKPNMDQVYDRLVKALPSDAGGTYFWIDTNRIVITCRTQDVFLCKQALRDY